MNSFDVPVSNRDIVASNSEYAENSSDAGDHRRKNAVNSLGSTASNFDRSIDVDRWGSITLDGTAKSVVLRVRNSAQATQRRSATLTRLIDLDSPSPLRKALGDEAFTNLTSGIARCVTSTALYFSLPWDDLSIDKAGSIGEYFVRTRMPVATGKNAEYRAYLKNDVKPVLEKGGVTWYRVSAPTFGGPAGTVETMRRLTNLAEIDGGPIQTKVLGAAGAQALAAKAATLTRGPAQNTILRSRAELSWLPPDMPAR
ncbi:MAG TPA: hypothetical protein VFA59_10040 [Vicinamibacterales bacterium]|nr:hypothetical protein [Vicinamibacterales bacterium]